MNDFLPLPAGPTRTPVITMLVDAVDGALLLDECARWLRRYVVVGSDALTAITLVVALTHVVDAFEVVPYLSVASAEKRSGKTLVLELVGRVVARPIFASRMTVAALVRSMATTPPPTLLLDEMDASLAREKEYSEALRGVLNAGNRRDGSARLLVPARHGWEVRDFPVFGVKFLAGIGELPDTVRDRSIRVEMRRRTAQEPIERARRRRIEPEAQGLRERLAVWAEASIESLREAEPVVPDQLDDRVADAVEPLVAIADLVGGAWPTRAREALVALCVGDARRDESLGARLLEDIRQAFSNAKVDRLSTVEIITALAADVESPWADWHGRGHIPPRALATLLGRFGIRSRSVRLDAGSTAKGYRRDQFEDAWLRYASAPRVLSGTAAQPDNGGPQTDLAIRHTDSAVPDAKPEERPIDTSLVPEVPDGEPEMANRRAALDLDNPATWPPAYRDWLRQTVAYAVTIGMSVADAERLGRLDIARQMAEDFAVDAPPQAQA